MFLFINLLNLVGMLGFPRTFGAHPRRTTSPIAMSFPSQSFDEAREEEIVGKGNVRRGIDGVEMADAGQPVILGVTELPGLAERVEDRRAFNS